MLAVRIHPTELKITFLRSEKILTKRAVRKSVQKKPSVPSAPSTNALKFFQDDIFKTLFPLKTNLFLIENGEAEIKSYIEKCLNEDEKAYSFLPQQRVYAAKTDHHLRRTVKLDVISEYYLYDTIHRNRSAFRKPHSLNREHYGYRFEDGSPISPTVAYRAFKGAIAEYSKAYKFFISLDVASYFNGVYHHDLVNWFRELSGVSDEDVSGLGQMLREINSGRSVDCLPQGLYPAKMIGNDFLRFVENYHGLKSEKIIRFMDDIYLFADDEQVVTDDFILIQTLLGDKGLSVNPKKTNRASAAHVKLDNEIDKIRENLLQRRRIIISTDYDDDDEVESLLLKHPLSDAELDYISKILARPDLEEEDAELVLTIMRDHAVKVESRLPDIVRNFPNLSKNVHNFCAGIKDKELIGSIILDVLKTTPRLLEFQLFWYAAILEDHLMSTKYASAIIDLLYNHNSATVISRARILEIQDSRFGLTELRATILLTGQSGWLGWSAAVGTRSLKSGSRNHVLKYFGNSSNMNHLVASIVSK